MKEKFSDYESKSKYLNEEGEFVFTITECELSKSKSGMDMVKFTAVSDAGETTLYHSLAAKARWSYNNLIKACLHLNTKEKIEAFECDYETIGQDLIGKQFVGVVEAETYKKEIKVPLDDGTFENAYETRESFKVTSYKEA